MTREELNKEISKKLTDEQNAENNKILIKRLVKGLVFLVIATTLFFAYTTYIATAKVIVREYRITNNKLPESFNGTKIIQLSDIHYGSTISDDELKSIVNMANERKPDLVVFTGDLLIKDYKLNSKEQEKIIKNLKNLSSTLGKYAILGDEDTEAISTIFNQSDFTILRDESELIYNDKNNPILLVGLTSESKGQDIDKAYSYFKEPTHNSNIFTITLLHEPDVVDDIVDTYKSDLFLGGHSHNGNIRIPFTKYSPFKVDGARKYDQDYYHINDSDLYVSSGLGTKGGIRFFCRPSMNFFRLSNK